jgi:hypothetical protein
MRNESVALTHDFKEKGIFVLELRKKPGPHQR